MTDTKTNDPGLCQNCQKNAACEDHRCPYDADVNNDSESQCNCCDDCEYQCAMNV